MPNYSGSLAKPTVMPPANGKRFYAYMHTKPDGTPFYIGKGNGRRVRNFSKRNQHHKNIVAKYGRENIHIGYMECSDESTAFDLEMGLIKCVKRMGIKLTNLTEGGHGVSGLVVTPEQRAKISATLTGRKGTPWSDEQRAKFRASTVGRKRTPEQIAKMREAGKNRKPPSDETRAKLSAGAKRFWERRKAMSGGTFRWSDEIRARMSEAQQKAAKAHNCGPECGHRKKGRIVPQHLREHLSKSQKAYWANKKRGGDV